MTVLHFLSLNLRDAEARLRRLTAPEAADQPELWQGLDASGPGRLIEAVRRALDHVRAESRVLAAWLAVTQAWMALNRLSQMRAVGAVALIAAGVHVALASTTAPVGLWWLIVPGLAGAFGVAAVVLSWLGPRATGGRR